jgi:hypothetical protein
MSGHPPAGGPAMAGNGPPSAGLPAQQQQHHHPGGGQTPVNGPASGGQQGGAISQQNLNSIVSSTRNFLLVNALGLPATKHALTMTECNPLCIQM